MPDRTVAPESPQMQWCVAHANAPNKSNHVCTLANENQPNKNAYEWLKIWCSSVDLCYTRWKWPREQARQSRVHLVGVICVYVLCVFSWWKWIAFPFMYVYDGRDTCSVFKRQCGWMFDLAAYSYKRNYNVILIGTSAF